MATVLIALMWTSVTVYALLGGADYGAGVWDLLAGGRRRGAPVRDHIAHAIGPVWEANHVWLIFVLVLMWTGFPSAYAAIASTLYLPLTLVALGVIARGAAFAFRKAIDVPWAQQAFGAAFAFSSVVTPFTLGAAAGAIASGRVPAGLARGNAVTSWINPTSLLTGVFAVLACAFLAAVYLTVEPGERELTDYFRRRALVSGVLAGALSLAGLAILHADAHRLFTGLTGRALPLVIAAGLCGTATLALAFSHRYAQLRITAAATIALVLWSWGLAQFPRLLPPDLTVDGAAAPASTLHATLVAAGVGALVLIPALVLLLRMPRTVPNVIRSRDGADLDHHQ
ncbi:MAG TPA: cytochrome d ubiquinol oxidase subunit II [Micromonosporaceae bacterium]